MKVANHQVSRLENRVVAGLMLGPTATPLPIRFKICNLRNVNEEDDDPDGEPIPLYALAAGPLRGLGLRHHQSLASAISRILVSADP